ncbi:MAG: nuclear transport factor 2 family protein, partial [Gammaproteobacteria bacterium]|jgi:hypothetical protein|nr:nuclear transport factor 2 family protein [Gammaproteobacteria bacterium]
MDNAHEIRNALIDNYNAYAQGLDSKDWPLVRSCFAREVLIDYGSISAPTGDPAIPRVAEDWMQVLQSVINGFDITRHTITNHRVSITDSRVRCSAYLTADHVIFTNPDLPVVNDEEVVTVVGEYTNDYQLEDDGWKICKSQLVVNWSSGNMALFEIAAQRAAAL